MAEAELLKELRRIVGPRHVSAGRADAEIYSYDASLALGAPEAVVFPADTSETAAVVAAASRAGVPCTPRGFGTNLSGGSVASRGGLVVALSRMNRILALEPARRTAVVQPGVTNLELQNALAPLGYFYAPDPASQKVATLGGNAAENSGGPHCIRYGVTTNHVLGLEAVLADGQAVRLGGAALDPPGLDLRGALIGSEGTFAIVTELTVRILPRPELVVTLLAVYDDVADAARSVAAIVARGIVPATLEMMDAPVMRAVEESFPCGYPLDAAAVLIIEVEGPAAGLREQAEAIREACKANGCRAVREAKDAAERDQLWAGRRGAFGAIARLAPNFLVADCTVPRTLLPEALARVAAIARRCGFAHGNVFHAGDGNLHPLLFFDSRDAGQLERVHEAGREIMRACVDLGGTITGEHGVGMEKIEALRMVFSEDDLAFQRSLRAAFDPRGLLNPGKVLPAASTPKQVWAWHPHSSLQDEGCHAQAALGRVLSDRNGLVPADEAEAGEMVRAALEQGRALLPLGGGRRADFGNLSEAPVTPLRSDGLAALIELDPANQTVTVGSGMKLADLQAALAEHNQWLPVRPPLADGCTAGGLVALGACGPERLRYWAPRDLLLGLRFISGAGKPIRAGGKVMKNVAGYDVTRLLAGSAGTLGFLTELTFRLLPRPEACRAVRGAGSPTACAAAAAGLLRSSLDPAFVSASVGQGGWELAAGFEGFEATVRAQADGARKLLATSGLGPMAERDYDLLEGTHAAAFARLWEAAFLVRADLPLDRAAAFAVGAGLGANALIDLGCGRVLAGLDDLADEQWERLCRLAAEAGGHAVLERAPAEFKRRHDVFGPARPEWALMHRVKAALDPRGLFAPGRLPGRK